MGVMIENKTGARITKEAVRAVAEWWGKIVGAPQRHFAGEGTELAGALLDAFNGGHNENGSESRFVDLLEERLTERIKEADCLYDVNECLDVDYGAPKFLVDIAKETGVHQNSFPWKTFCRFDFEGNASGRNGYQSEWEDIYTEKMEATA